jgi:hypothetical protein
MSGSAVAVGFPSESIDPGSWTSGSISTETYGFKHKTNNNELLQTAKFDFDKLKNTHIVFYNIMNLWATP